MKTRRQTLAILAGLPVAAIPSLAQERARTPSPPEDMVAHKAFAMAIHGEDVTFDFVSSEMNFVGRVVKGAPYAAEAVTESTQTLADGNRIVNRNSATLYRDGEGRTRREQTLGSIGPWAASGDPPLTIFINDPVSGTNYILDPKNRTARKVVLPMLRSKPGEGGEGQMMAGIAIAGPPEGGMIVSQVLRRKTRESSQTRTESLGRQTIEGLQADGARTITTIPVGEIGNDRPIEVVSERWFSPELQVAVLTRRSDPRMGETVYKLTNVRRSEPARSLFEVPADYTIQDDSSDRLIRMEKMRKAIENAR